MALNRTKFLVWARLWRYGSPSICNRAIRVGRSQVQKREIWTKVDNRLIKTIRYATKQSFRSRQHLIGEVVWPIPPRLQGMKSERSIFRNLICAVINVDPEVLGEGRQFNLNGCVCGCFHDAPIDNPATVHCHRFFNAIKDFEIIPDLVKQIFDGRGICDAPSPDL